MSRFVWVPVIFCYPSQVFYECNFRINKLLDYRDGDKLPALVTFWRYDPVHGDCTAFIFSEEGGTVLRVVMCFWIRNRIIIEEILFGCAEMYTFWSPVFLCLNSH